MATAEPPLYETCGRRVSESDLSESRLRSGTQIAPFCEKNYTCSQCGFVCQNEKDLSDHLQEHKHLAAVTPEAGASDVSSTKKQRRKRKMKSNTASALAEDRNEEQPERERDGIKRVREAAEKDKASLHPEPLPSKEYLAEGSEHIYRTHTCPKCRRCFKMRSHLQEHLHLHFPDPALQCHTCKRFFTSRSKLRLHRLREAGEKTHRCHLCDYSAVESNAIRRHVARIHPAEHDGNSPCFPCPTCGLSFHLSRRLKAHMKTHHTCSGNQQLSCFRDDCSFKSTSSKELVKHAAGEHAISAVACKHHACDAVFQSAADMQVHYRTHLAYHCSLCDFSCSNKTLLLQHQRQGHTGNDKLCCNFCSFVTFNPVDFEQHVGHLHANEKIHRCVQCSFVTAHKRGLKRHMLMHSGEKPHTCSLCDFRCRDESYLSKHMLTHSNHKDFMCAECGYVTKWKHYLTVHMRKHAGDLRYQCDKCSYRCHRMDQLNSHKLRHQPKSLMCEICAYACKRKYELRNHMLVKHSGEQKQLSVFKCKYCTYTTCYKQALQNHENCKHTKVKEFRCALCFYSSFSSISLFLHKRKTHGYVPGDKVWIQNYAAKERERNSSEVLQDFYNKPVTAQKPEQSPSEGPQAEISDCPRSAGQSMDEEEGAGSRKVVSVDICDSQEVVKDVPPSGNNQQEYCTLVLTTLSTTEYEQDDPSLSCRVSHKSQEKGDHSSSPEEGNNAADSDLDDNYEPLKDASQPAEPAESQTETPIPGAVESLSEPILKSEGRLRAMKNHDKAQADAMVLEGRVQLLVVPVKDAHCCDKCSYVTRKESALKYHQKAVCPGRIKGYKCSACGAEFKQKRGLDSHRKRKCPAVQRKTRRYVGVSASHSESGEIRPEAREGSRQLDDEEEEATCKNGTTLDSNDEILQEDDEGVGTSNLGIIDANKGSTLRESDLSGLKKKRLTKEGGAFTRKKPGNDEDESFYTKKGRTFHCKFCKFKAAKLAKVKRHLSTCKHHVRKREKSINLEGDGNESLQEREGVVEKCDQRVGNDSEDGGVQKKSPAVSSEKDLQCPRCPFTCKQERRLARHEALKHKDARPHCCRFCPFSTARRYRLDEHESLHTGVGRRSCDVCDKTFGTLTKLRQHKIRIHDKQPTHFCSLCDFSGYTQNDVHRHSARCHKGELQHDCTHCQAQFSSEAALRNHRRRVHALQTGFSGKDCEENPKVKQVEEARALHLERLETNKQTQQRTPPAQPCHLCTFAAKTKQLLARHLLSEHEDDSEEEKPLRCSACQFTCRHQVVLEQHLRSHGGKRLYKCTDCEYSTRNKQKMTWHIRIHTGEKPYSCEQCSYACTDPSRLKLHMRVHGEEKKYLCPECGYKCKWATQLKYHMTKHTGEKPHACDECDYRTNRADALRAHKDTQHCDLRPYVCEKCGKTFKTTFILKTHQRQHGDDRPYTCGLCPKAFRWPAGLRHHFLSHTQQTPFRCRLCSYSAKQKFQVVKHLKKHHPEESADTGVVRVADAGSLTLKEALQGALQDRGGGEKEAGDQGQEDEEEQEVEADGEAREEAGDQGQEGQEEEEEEEEAE